MLNFAIRLIYSAGGEIEWGLILGNSFLLIYTSKEILILTLYVR